MLFLMLEPFLFMSSCFFQVITSLLTIISLQKLLFLSQWTAGTRQHREEKEEKHRPRWGCTSLPWLGKTEVFTMGLQTHHLKNPSCLCNKCAGKGIFFPCSVFWRQQATGKYLSISQTENGALDGMKSKFPYVRSYDLIPTWKQGITLFFPSKW